jgi:hypothetical protein
MRGKTEQMIDKLAACVDTDRVLRELQLTEKQALVLLRNKAGRRAMAWRRRLSKIHVEIVANRYSPYAVQKICELIESGKDDAKLKGALSLLDLARLGKVAEKSKRKQEAVPTAEDLKLLELMAKVMNPALAEEPPAEEEYPEEKDVDNGMESK